MFKKINLFYEIMIILAFVLSLNSFAVFAANETYEMKFATVFAIDYPITHGIDRLVETVKERSGGRLIITHYPAGQLGGEREISESVQMGVVQAYMAGVGNYFIDNRQSIYNYPYSFDTFDHILRFRETPIVREFEKFNLENGLLELDTWFRGTRHTNTTTKPINSIEDLQGLKIRVPESKTWVLSFEALGAKPTPMARPEVYTALELGTLDGQESDFGEMIGFGLAEVCDYVALTSHVVLSGTFYINVDFFNSLPADLQVILVKSIIEEGKEVRKAFELSDIEGLNILKEAGMEATYPDLEPFKEKALSALPSLAKEIMGEELAIEYLKYLEETR